ncbi:MucB/RseB C-terminal domain-containing protein [Rhodoferax sp. U2-2l]|uniref:MucB/RseB C-terminal domain-containing protein n=1 Tax=Rhodoferax sp. U2-2l TaxID=2884000 RepID=UPI001D09D81D|nr:MucB/RseB C-terminal domain-containing protein [Rhodoferax sp. U2-2l]MCB8746675.1 MucB/RseB C-terminal domain-containing protein [Rhodoferax sp. U2-2l]
MKFLVSLVLCVSGWLAHGSVWAQPAPAPTPESSDETTGVARWLMRLHEAPRARAYMGTFVVTTGSDMSTSRIWHVGNGDRQMERVESLTGTARTTFRRNDEVVTFLPGSRTVIHETREALGLFPNLLNRADAAVSHFYRLRSVGQGRVAGFEADIVQLMPLDLLRFGYQIWTEQKTGLMVKLQTLDPVGNVLEQAAFSELQLDAPVAMAKLTALMDNTQGYRVISPTLVKTTAEAEGWLMATPVPGFAPVRCYKRLEGGASAANPPLQCVYSDGLASVSLFIELFDPQRHGRLQSHHLVSMGATSLRMRQLGSWWVTAVGEVPPQTLAAFVQALERKR